MARTSDQAPIWPRVPGSVPGSDQAPENRGFGSRIGPLVVVLALALAAAAIFAALYQGRRLPAFSLPGTVSAVVAAKPATGCAPLPAGYTSGARVYVISTATPQPSGSLGANGPQAPITGAPTGPTPPHIRVCGVGFHPRTAISLTLSAYPGAPYLTVSAKSITSDANGSFATTIVVAQTGQCTGPQSGARIRALDTQGTAATISLSTLPTCLPGRA